MYMISPATAADLQIGTRMLALQERGMGAEIEIHLLECVSIRPTPDETVEWVLPPHRRPGELIHPDAHAFVTFRNLQTGSRVQQVLKASTPIAVAGGRL